MTLKLIVCLAVVLVSTVSVSGHQEYQLRIPNGANVPNPFQGVAGYEHWNVAVWGGVGHRTPEGQDARGPFGVAFKDAGERWTEDLCNADTDGDGSSNGKELGDPNCEWTQGGSFVPLTTNLGHPGICEPVTSADCKEKNAKWLNQTCGEGADSSEEECGTAGLNASLLTIAFALIFALVNKFFV